MMTKLTLSLAGVVLACIGLHASSQSSLSVADDAAVQDLYGGACMAKTAITCNGADPSSDPKSGPTPFYRGPSAVKVK